MPLNEFWHGNIELMDAYKKAYVRNITYMAWVQGNYNMFAVEKGVRNAIATKKEHIDRTWIDYTDPIEKYDKPIITKDNLEEEFRKSQARQNEWLSNILRK